MEEKKSIGKFLSALRQAKGLTQKELGDMLYVSNKTVSRWERDECLPDLYLIPAIAEIFEITSDELLRGEIKNSGEEKYSAVSSARAESRFSNFAHKKYLLFRNLSFIPFILALFALISAVICVYAGTNYTYERGYADILWLGFVLALLFSGSGIVCEFCFALNGLITKNDCEFQELLPKIQAHNAKILSLAAAAVFTDIAVFAYCLPLLFLMGEQILFMFLYWLAPGAELAEMFAVAAYAIYHKTVRRKFTDGGIISYSQTQSDKIKSRNKLLLVLTLVCGIIFIALVILTIWIQYFYANNTYAYPHTYLAMLANAIIGLVVYAAVTAAYTKKLSK